MCGLVGCAGLLTSVEERIFRQLLILDSLRGEHSTGVAAVGMTGEVLIAKNVGDPFQLFDTKGYEAIMRRANRVLIGHNRYATTGKINRRNAHPFEFDRLVGAHNGTLHNKFSLKNHHIFDVDSEALYSHIDEEGLDEAIKLVRGAWALTWYNKENETINFLRNEERPLFYCISESKKVIFWASEAWMLQSVFNREGYKVGKVYVLPVDTHYSFSVNLKEADKHVFEKAKARQVKGAPPLQTNSYNVSYIGGANSTKKVETKNTTTHTKASYDDSYLGRKIVFEIGGIDKDTSNVQFVFLDDSLKPDYDVRMYSHLKTYTTGAHISAIVSGCRRDDNGALYYIIDPKTVTEISVTANKSDSRHQHKDDKGNVIPDADLTEYYSTCCWCASPIDHNKTDTIFMGIEHGAICGDCAEDSTVKEFLRG